MIIESEMTIIGCVLKDNNCYDLIPTNFGADDFSRNDHQIIYRTIQSLLDTGKPVDAILLAESLEAQQYLQRAGGLPYITALIESAYATKNLLYYIKIVKSESVRRHLKGSINDIQSQLETSKDPVDIAMEADQKISAILESKQDNDYVHIGAAVAEAIEWESSEHKAISTGLEDLDALSGGLNKGNLIILAARPSMGKSSLAMQIAEHVSNYESVAVFSLEMTKREIASRMIRYHRSLLGSDIKVTDHLFSLKLHIDDTPSIGLGHIRTRCRRIKRQHGLSLVVIDYLQLMTGKGENRNQEIGAISRGLKAVAKEFDIPIIVLSQLNRKGADRADKRPVMSDLRESGEIEQDADMILFIHRDEASKEGVSKTKTEIICSKNRNGPTGARVFTFDGETTRFGNYDGEQYYGEEQQRPKRRESFYV